MRTDVLDEILANRRRWSISYDEVLGQIHFYLHEQAEVSLTDALEYLRRQPESEFSRIAVELEELAASRGR